MSQNLFSNIIVNVGESDKESLCELAVVSRWWWWSCMSGDIGDNWNADGIIDVESAAAAHFSAE